MGRRVDRIVVRKRFGNEWTDVRDFVRPNDYMVECVLSTKASWSVQEVWRWVVDNIQYPPGSGLTLDRHTLIAFHLPVPLIGFLLPRKVYSTPDFWEFPAEVLRDGIADCEGMSVLLVSMLRRLFPTLKSFVTVGYFKERGHVWCSINENGRWLVIDATVGHVLPTMPPESIGYRPLFRFNEKEVILESEELVVPERVYGEPWYAVIDRSIGGIRYGI